MNTKIVIKPALIFITILLYNSCLQKENQYQEPDYSITRLVLLKEERSVLKDGGEKNSGKQEETTETTVGLFSKDSIKVYNCTEKKLEEDQSEVFTLENNGFKNQKVLKHQKQNKNKTTEDSLLISFEAENIVYIDKNRYHLNTEYYEYLRDKILKENIVHPLAGLIKYDFDEYYSQYKSLFKAWFPDYKKPEYKILKVEHIVENKWSDCIYIGLVQYNYENDDLVGIKMLSDVSTYEKKLIAENNIYKVYSMKNTGLRTFEESKVYYNKVKKYDSVITIQAQYPKNIITNILYYPVFRKEYHLGKSKLNTSQISSIVFK